MEKPYFTKDSLILKNLPGPTVQLILAEEAYLRAGGWTKSCTGFWSNPEYGMKCTRTYAMILSKSRDQNNPLWW